MPDGTTHHVRINRAHLEEDAGKNQHEGLPHSQVDLNRAGTPLLEIVTEPDLETAEQCRILAQELQKIMQFLEVSDANMQLGQIRFEPNINLIITEDGKTYKTPITRGEEPEQLPRSRRVRLLTNNGGSWKSLRKTAASLWENRGKTKPRLGRRQRRDNFPA